MAYRFCSSPWRTMMVFFFDNAQWLIYGCGAHMAADRDLYPSSKRRRRRFREPWVDEKKRSSHHHIRFAKQSPRSKGNVGTSMMAAPTAWYQHGWANQCLLLRGFSFTYEVCCWCTGAADRAQPSSFLRLRLSQSQACQTRTHAAAADPPISRPTTENSAAANGCTRTSDRENTGPVRKSGHHSIDPRTAINLHHSKHAAHHERPAQQNEQGARLANSISYFNLTQPQKQNKSNSLTLQVRKFSSSIKNRRSYNNHPNAEENHLVHRNTRIASKPPVQTHPVNKDILSSLTKPSAHTAAHGLLTYHARLS